jgi:hypothetical protein
MAKQTHQGNLVISELREFASFSPREQRYIRVSLDIALNRESDSLFSRWSRNRAESEKIYERQEAYKEIGNIKKLIPANFWFHAINELMGPLSELSAFDLEQGQLESFSAYRFLYERIFGAKIRPWLPSSFCAAGAMPNIPPALREELLQSISKEAATAPGWSTTEPMFFPEWVEKEIA